MGAKNTKPYWHSDADFPNCEVCGDNFSVTKRRHHCRNCGAVCCNKCSFRKVAVQARGIKEPARVCDSCYVSIVTNDRSATGGAGTTKKVTGGTGGDTALAPGNGAGRPQSPSQMNGNVFPSSSSPIPDVEPTVVSTQEEKDMFKQILGSVLFADVNEVAVDPPNLTDDVGDTTYEPRMTAADPDFEIGLPAGADDSLNFLLGETSGNDENAAGTGASSVGPSSDNNKNDGGSELAIADEEALCKLIKSHLPHGNNPADPFLAPFEPVGTLSSAVNGNLMRENQSTAASTTDHSMIEA